MTRASATVTSRRQERRAGGGRSLLLANLKSAAEIRASRSNINYNSSLSQVVAAASLSLLSQSYLTQVKLLKLVNLDVSSVTPRELASLARCVQVGVHHIDTVLGDVTAVLDNVR